MNQDSSDSKDSVKQVVNPKKRLYSSLITLAKRKHNIGNFPNISYLINIDIKHNNMFKVKNYL